MKHVKNRLQHLHADYLFAIVQPPLGWNPSSLDEVPAGAKVLSQEPVASYEEAFDDLVRCNKLAVKQRLEQWAVVFHPGSDI